MPDTNDLSVEFTIGDKLITNTRSVLISELNDNIINDLTDQLNALKDKYLDELPFLVNGNIVTINDGTISINNDLILTWEEDQSIQNLITCNEPEPESNVEWELVWTWPEPSEIASEYCNELMSILGGEGSSIHFFWEVYGEEGYDSYSYTHKYNPDGKFPNSESFLDFYEGDDSAW